MFTAVKVESCNVALALDDGELSVVIDFLHPVANEMLNNRTKNPFCRFRFMGISCRG